MKKKGRAYRCALLFHQLETCLIVSSAATHLAQTFGPEIASFPPDGHSVQRRTTYPRVREIYPLLDEESYRARRKTYARCERGIAQLEKDVERFMKGDSRRKMLMKTEFTRQHAVMKDSVIRLSQIYGQRSYANLHFRRRLDVVAETIRKSKL